MRGKEGRQAPRCEPGRRRFLSLSALSLVAGAAGGLVRSIRLGGGRPPPQGREARYYRRIGRGRRG